ncbi:MAG: thioredoxin family protein [Bacteroidota bacterium]
MRKIAPAVMQKAATYAGYRERVDQLLAEGKSTGPHQSDALTHYSELNVARMRRLDKTTKLQETTFTVVQSIDRPMIWLTLTEGWCGDAAQIVPVVEKIAAENELVEHRIILRDEHPEVMDMFLTNGGRSIPKIIFLDANSLEVLGDWGPRPSEIQARVMEAVGQLRNMESGEEKKAYEYEVKKDVQLWYAKDKTRTIQAEFLNALEGALATASVD